MVLSLTRLSRAKKGIALGGFAFAFVGVVHCSAPPEFEAVDYEREGEEETSQEPAAKDPSPTAQITDGGALPKEPKKYYLPWKCGDSFRVTAGNFDFHHKPPDGQYAWDFGMPKGTPVLAVRSGRVSFSRGTLGPGDECYLGCIGKNLDTCCPVCINKANGVTVDHGDGSYARYAHLDTVAVAKDVYVKAGELIGTVGTTGCSTGYHLHFEVVRKDYYTLPINFEEVAVPKAGTSPVSKNSCPLP